MGDISLSSNGAVYEAKLTVVPRWKSIALATYYSLVACLGGLQMGFVITFSSPLLDDFQTHLPPNFTAWSGFNHCVYQDLIGPIGPVGAVVGSVLSSPVVAVTGFVTGLVIMSLFSVAGWLLIGVSYFTYHGGAWSAVWFRTLLLLGRLLTGVSAGWATGVVPVYVADVSPPSVRGKLGSLFDWGIAIGSLLTYLLGTYMLYWQVAFICTGIFAVQLVLMFTIGESPRLSTNPLKNMRVFLTKWQRDSVKKSNGSNDTILQTMALPTSHHNSKHSTKSHLVRIAIVGFLMLFQVFTGVDTITCLAGPIFRAAGVADAALSSGLLSTLTIGVVQVVFISLSFFVVDWFGRRIPLFFGSLALMVANLGMVVYFTASFGFVPTPGSVNSSTEHRNASIQNCLSVQLEPSPLASHLSALPIASVCFFFAAFSLSWSPGPWVIAGELFPDQIRELGMGIGGAISWVSMFVAITVYPVISASVGQAIPFLVLAVFSLLSSIFVVLFLVETKGLRLDEISSMEVVNVRKNVKEFGCLLGWLLRGGFVRKMDLPHGQG